MYRGQVYSNMQTMRTCVCERTLFVVRIEFASSIECLIVLKYQNVHARSTNVI